MWLDCLCIFFTGGQHYSAESEIPGIGYVVCLLVISTMHMLLELNFAVLYMVRLLLAFIYLLYTNVGSPR